MPLRALLVLLLIGVTVVAFPRVIYLGLWNNRKAIMLVAAAALLAFTASTLNGLPLSRTLGQMVEIHLQAVFGLLVGFTVAYFLGIGGNVLLFAIPVTVSGVFALMQFAGVGFAWELSWKFAALQPRPGLEDLAGDDIAGRPGGLSYSSVHLGTQACLLFAAVFGYWAYRYGTKRLFEREVVRVGFLVVFVVAICIFSGNRSPVLGLAIFTAVYLALSSPTWKVVLLLAIPLALILGEGLILALAEMGLRTFDTTNSSAQGRQVLRAYGILLMIDQPWGYGLAFNSTEHYLRHWGTLERFPNANAISIHALHNYFLMVVNKHGILLLALAPFVVRAMFASPAIVLAFTPYIVHIFFHNDGPLQADFMIWYLFPVFLALARRDSRRRRRAAPLGARPFPR